MSLRFKLLLGVGLTGLAFAVYAMVAWNTIAATKVGGPAYRQIAAGKDLVADVLPPPEYIVEAYLVAHQLATASPAEVGDLTERLQALHKDYENRHAYWSREDLEPRTRSLLLEGSYGPASEFFAIAGNELVPAARRGDQVRAAAIITTRLEPLFRQHRAAIDQVVALANEHLAGDEKAVAGLLRARSGWLTAVVGLAVVALAFLAFLVDRVAVTITRRLGGAVRFADAMAKGDLTRSLPEGPNDEVGRLIRALNEMGRAFRGVIGEITGGIQTVASASTELSAVSGTMSLSARDMNDLAGDMTRTSASFSQGAQNVAANMQQAAANLHTVAAATTELSETVNSISSSSGRARTVSDEATRQAQAVSLTMSELERAAREIGQVTEAISDISSQTNLLALNATIEAAHAGDAGRGFAVVASEIKELARQTTNATEDIKRRIGAIQASTGSAMSDITAITGVIAQMSEYTNTIAVAIEEQTAVTRDVAANISQANAGVASTNNHMTGLATGSESIADGIARVNEGLGEITRAGEQVDASANELSRLGEALRQSVSRFRCEETVGAA